MFKMSTSLSAKGRTMDTRRHSDERPLLGELLVAEGKLTITQLQEALAEQLDRLPRVRLGRVLLDLGHVGVNDLYAAICRQVGLPASIF